MIKIKPTRLFNTIKSNKASFVHRLPIALVLFALMLSPFAALAQTAELTIADVAVDEDAGTVSINVLLNESIAEEVTARVTANGGTAVKGTDYDAEDQTLTFAADTANQTQSFDIVITEDDIVELDETFTVSILSVSTTGITFTDTAQVTINNDMSDTAELTIEDVEVNEGGVSVELTVTLIKALPEALTVTIATADGTAIAGTDYVTAAPTLTFAADTANQTQSFDIEITEDDIVELDETFTVSIASVSATNIAANVVHADTAEVTINNDMSDTAELTIEDVEVNEGSVSVELTVTLIKALPEALTVTIATADGTAIAGTDYVTAAPTLTFAADTANQTQSFDIEITEDDIVELDETFTVSIASVSATNIAANVVHADTAEVTINNDMSDTAELTIEDVEVNEGGVSVELTVTLIKALPEALTVTIATADGTAIAGTDYVTAAPTLTFAADTANQTQSFDIEITEDDIVELDETFTVSIASVSATNIAANVVHADTAEVTINNDMSDTAELTIEDVEVNEGGVSVELTVTLIKALPEALTVTIATADGTAIAGTDYVTAAPTLTFAADTANQTQSFDIEITEDDIVELDETFTVSIASVSATNIAANVVHADTAEVTIEDDNDSAIVTVQRALTVEEGTANVEIAATLSHSVSGGLIVNVATSNGTAASGEDYTTTNGALTFVGNANETQSLNVPITDNSIAEPAETFTVSYAFADDRGGRITLNPANTDTTVTINDNDFVGITLSQSGPVLITESMTAAEESSTATYTVALTSEPIGGNVTVDIVSTNTATDSDNDVTVDPETLTFTATNWNMAQSVTIIVTKDADAVDDSANLMHTASGGDYDGLPVVTLPVAVTDDDEAGITFSTASVTILENDDMAVQTYTVILATQPTANVNVAIASTNTATDTDNNVTVSPQSLTFTAANWDMAQSVTITAAHDDDAVDDSANLTHTAMGGDYGDGVNNVTTATLTVMVTDDEVAGITLNPGSITMDENAQEFYTVVLNTQPTAEVNVAIVSSNNDVRVNRPTLIFTTDNWGTAQPVRIIEADDADAVDDTANLTHTATGGDYSTANVDNPGSPVSGLVEVEVTDPETAGIIFNRIPPTVGGIDAVDVNEGADQTYTVELDTEPFGGDVTVTIARIDEDNSMGRLTISPSAELTFTTATWNVARSVTVDPGSQDDDDDGYMQMFRHTAAAGDGDYDGLTADLTVTVGDTDTISRDNRLSGLTISANGPVLDSNLNLNPYQFDPDITDYALIINNAGIPTDSTSTHIMVTATLSDDPDPDLASATAELISDETVLYRIDSGTDQEIDEEVVNLEPGRNDLQIVVTAEDNSSRTYAITVARIDRVVLNDVKLVAGTDCNAPPVAAVSIMNTVGYSACVDRFPMDTAGTVLFTILQPDTPTTLLDTLDMERDLLTNTIGTDSYTVDSIIVVPSTQTYLMMTVFLDGTRVYEVRYPITNETIERTDMDNDGIPDTVEMMRNAPDFSTNLVIVDSPTTTMRQIVVSDGQRIALGDYARRAASAGYRTSGGLIYTAELDIATTRLESIGIPMPENRYTYNDEGIYDFVVYLPIDEDVASIVIPLASPLEANRDYIKYTENDGWSDFMRSAPDDEYYSAHEIVTGTCPMPPPPVPSIPDDRIWMPGLNMGHSCMLLRISDGGLNDADRNPNDTDRIRNGIVVDPGAIVIVSRPGDPRSSGSGASDLWFLLLMLLISTLAIRRKQPLS